MHCKAKKLRGKSLLNLKKTESFYFKIKMKISSKDEE